MIVEGTLLDGESLSQNPQSEAEERNTAVKLKRKFETTGNRSAVKSAQDPLNIEEEVKVEDLSALSPRGITQQNLKVKEEKSSDGHKADHENDEI
jgi:hypothetical protein